MPDRLAGRAARGRQAEDLAATLLEAAGMRIVARNWSQRGVEAGEIDIVADEGGTCVFVEVRSRTGEERGHPLETITPQKRARVVRAARMYLDAEAPRATGYRFDVVAVTFAEGQPPEITHIADAFEVGS